MRAKRKNNNDQKSSKKQKLMQNPVAEFVNDLLLKNNFAWLNFMNFTDEQKNACRHKFTVMRDEETGEGINIEENRKKNKRNRKKEIKRYEYPLVTAIMNGENIKLIEELLKVTPLDFLTETDEICRNIFIKMFQRNLKEIRQQTEEFFIVELLIKLAVKQHITINWLISTFSECKTALEYALSNRVDGVTERLLDLILPSMMSQVPSGFQFYHLMNEAFNSPYPKPKTIKKLISKGGIVKKEHLIIFDKIKKEPKSRPFNIQILTEEAIEIFKNSQIDVESCLFKDVGYHKNNNKVKKVIMNSFKEEMSQQSWLKLEAGLLKPYTPHGLYDVQIRLNTINDSLKKIEDKEITPGKWSAIAVDAIRKNHPLIHTLIKKGLDLDETFDKNFKLSFKDYIALYSYDEDLLDYLDSSSASGNAFGLTTAHYAALAYPKNIAPRNRSEIKEVVTFKISREFGSVEKFQKVFSVTSAFDTDFLKCTAMDYVRMNANNSKKNELFQFIKIELKRGMKILTSHLGVFLLPVLTRIIFEYINIPLKQNSPELDEKFIEEALSPEDKIEDGLAKKWALAFLENAQNNMTLSFRNSLKGYLNVNQSNPSIRDNFLNCLKTYASSSLLCENMWAPNYFIFTFNTAHLRNVAARILNINPDEKGQRVELWNDFIFNGEDDFPNIGNHQNVQWLPTPMPNYCSAAHTTTEQSSKALKDSAEDGFFADSINPLNSSSSSSLADLLNFIPGNSPEDFKRVELNSSPLSISNLDDLKQLELNTPHLPQSPRFFIAQNKNLPSPSNNYPCTNSFLELVLGTSSRSSSSSSAKKDELIAILNGFCQGGMNKNDLKEKLDPFINKLSTAKDDDAIEQVLKELKAELNKYPSRLYDIAEQYGLVLTSWCESGDEYNNNTEGLSLS